MRHIRIMLCILLYALFVAIPPVAAVDPPSIQVINDQTSLGINFNNYNEERITEITPWALENKTKTGGNYLFLVSSNKTFLCDFADNIFGSVATPTVSSCKFRQGSTINRATTNGVYNTSLPLWRRDFYGSFSGHMITDNEGTMIYAVNHGELLNNNYFMSLGQPCYPSPDIGYGTSACTNGPQDLSYNAFVTISKFNFGADYFSTKEFIDLGPIVWPANGYVRNGSKATGYGILHPSSIVKDNYLYVFYRDTSYGTEPGRNAGLKVARAPITGNGVDPSAFKTYFNGDFTANETVPGDFSENALPAGFDPARLGQFFSQPGGKSTALFNDAHTSYLTTTYSFSAAKLIGTSYYLGVSDDLVKGIVLRMSPDLVHWSNPVVIPGLDKPIFTGNFVYTRLANTNGDSNSEIDPHDFYVIGTNNHVVSKIHLKLTSLPISTPPPTTPGDFTYDGHVNNNDITVVQSHFGNPYTIFDYNTVIENFGK